MFINFRRWRKEFKYFDIIYKLKNHEKKEMSLNIRKLVLLCGKLLLISCVLLSKTGKHFILAIGSCIYMPAIALNCVFLESNGICLIH